MAIGRMQLTSDAASQAMLDGLTSRIREELRGRIQDRIQPDIDAAVEAALGAFKVAIQAHRDPICLQDTVRVLIERRDKVA